MNRKKDDNYKIAIVNSSTFGRNFPDLMEELEEIGNVTRFQVESNAPGGELAEKLAGYDFVVASVNPRFSREFFRQNDSVELIARHGIGCDNVDISAATDAGVVVTRVEGEYERDAVAELTLALILTCSRGIIPASEAAKGDNWSRRREFVGRELSRMEVGVVGYGNIGSRVAEIIREGYGADVSAYDPNVADAVIAKNGINPVGFEEILTGSDLLSFNASLNDENYHFIGEEEFEMMRQGVIIVNTARGELLDEEAFVKALRSGKVRCAGLDVLEDEPPDPGSPMVNLDNLYVLPHVGSYTDYSLRAMDAKMVEDIKRLAAGELPGAVVNPAVLRAENRAGVRR